jgi:hypothetical protein
VATPPEYEQTGRGVVFNRTLELRRRGVVRCCVAWGDQHEAMAWTSCGSWSRVAMQQLFVCVDAAPSAVDCRHIVQVPVASAEGKCIFYI